jgi:hypothetical protein
MKYIKTNEGYGSEKKLKSVIKTALENMYMFGGMPKPDPNYDRYLNNMINVILDEINKQ